jgi:plastocyanin
MNEILALFILFTCGGSSTLNAHAGEGSISGHVVITKVLTKKRITLPSYDMRGVAVNSESPNKPASIDPTVDELSRVIIYLEGPGLKSAAPLQETLTQKNRHFDPEIVAVPVGSSVSFPNEDPIFHNVFSLSKVKQFDLGYYPAGETRSIRFDKPGIVQVYCHIHPDMSAAIVVLPTAFWTRPGTGGRFAFTGIPPGGYDLVAWHRSTGFFRRHISVTEGGTVNQDFVIPVKEIDSSVAAKPGSAR